ncbi:MAG: DUF4386 domain-containing protein [Anaerolineales bacterium]|nr:DUF4386 domain-containing protein [Anaerolineales bacterium]
MTAYKSSIQMTARIAATLTLLIVVLAPFSMLYIPTTLVVPGDAATTANNIMASQGLFRAGMVSDSIVFLIEIVLTVLLYVLLKPVDKTLSLAAAFSRLAMTVIQGINLLNHFIVLLLLSGASYLTVFAPDQLQALVLLFLNAHESVTLIWGLFFGLHLLIFSYLVYKSGYLPKFLGIILFVVALCYFIQDFGNILFPQYKVLFTSIGSLAFLEIVFPLWLLVKGVNIEQWEKRIAESA